MAYDEFKRRIDTARNILVGAVPSPAGQIDQITYALMYKFMNDIDDQSAALPGGKRTYFKGDYEKYNWHMLMSSTLGAHERLELYRQAIQNMAKNPGLPELFREIYQNAFLPFNSPTVLNLFLKEMDKFSHDESDDIGDAYEYLLSITGAQGDVGQFRTPRHIIKFIVDAVNPTKDDAVLDPACGTAGFLIEAYSHVKSQHDGHDDAGNSNDENRLTADELAKLHKNYHGFDIDPTMVRTSRVNMYLHGFTTPDIINHDTLSSEDFWDKRYDVILANPPFMTPKGGIQPHKKFSIVANRAEVLFVDYIASHINPVSGRAGIIVPEGIIFQSGNAYKQLRKNLVENSLYAVVSLPSGVFNPYAGVKTSILLLDKELAKKRAEVLFVDVKNIGVTLDTKQNTKLGNQLPEALDVIRSFKSGDTVNSIIGHVVSRSKISESPDYNLSGSRYIDTQVLSNSDYPAVELGELISESRDRVKEQSIPVWSVSNKHGFVDPEAHFSKQVASEDKSNYKVIKHDYFAYNPSRINVGSLALNSKDESGCVSPMYVVFTVDKQKILPKYLLRQIEGDAFNQFVADTAQGAVRTQLKFADLVRFKIPLPPVEIQREIVTELDGYQKIIDAAQTIIKTYKPTIKINPEWTKVPFPDVVFLQEGPGIRSYEYDDSEEAYPIINVRCVKDGYVDTADGKKVKRNLADGQWKHFKVDVGDILFTISGTIGRSAIVTESDLPLLMNTSVVRFRSSDGYRLANGFLYVYVNTDTFIDELKSMSTGMAQLNVGPSHIKTMTIPLPPMEIQRKIVAKLEAEQKLIDANKKLIGIYQQKIKDKIAEVWGD